MVHCRCGRGIPNRAPYGGTFSAAGEILRGLPREGTVGEELPVSLTILLLIVLVILIVASAPTWPHSRQWGYAPGSVLTVILLILLLLYFTGNLNLSL